MAGITVKNVAINGNNISFVLPKGDVLVKTVGTFSMPQSAKFTFPITPEAESSNGFWFPITRDLNIKDGFRPTVTNGGNQISKARIYAKVGKPIGTNSQGHQLYSISKLGFCALNVNNYIEDFECADGTLQSAMSKLVGENLGNGTGIVKLREANSANTATTTAQTETGTTGTTNTGATTAQTETGTTGTSTTQTTRRKTFDRRVYKMQAMLNDAGYTDNSNRPLEEDGLLGPKTMQAAQKAGIDPRTWNGTPRLTPANANTGATTAQTETGTTGTTNTGATTAQTETGTTGTADTGATTAQTSTAATAATPTYSAADYAKAGVAMNNAQNSLNQTKEALFNKIDRIINQNGVKKGDKQAAEQIKQYVNAGDYRRALAAANYIYWPNRRKAVTDLLTQNMDAFDAHQSLSQQAIYKDINGEQPQQTVNERRTKKARMTEGKLVDMLTEKVLGENSKKNSNKSVMSESKLVDMIAESMIKNGVINL